MNTIVVAKFKEDCGWLFPLEGSWHIRCYNKGSGELPNVGREAHTYLTHIVRNYRYLQGDTIFCQGNPFDHDPEFFQHVADGKTTFGQVIGCTIGGAYDSMSFVHEYCRILNLPVKPVYPFVAGAQFRVSAEQILERPKEFYEALLALTIVDPSAPYTLERLWLEIFGIPA